MTQRMPNTLKCLLCVGLFLLFLCSCGTIVTYPNFVYRSSAYRYDIQNRTVLVPDGYVLDDSNQYEIRETKDGYDITFHMVKE